MGAPDTIVVHHSASSTSTTVEQIRGWHRDKGWRDIGYHWLVTDAPGEGPTLHLGRDHDLDGEWEPWEYGAHARGHNSHTIGICLVGSHSDYAPSDEALTMLHGWLVAICLNWGLTADDVRGHREMEGASTECPGTYVDMDQIRERIRKAMEPS
jgi:hypothetical protein